MFYILSLSHPLFTKQFKYVSLLCFIFFINLFHFSNSSIGLDRHCTCNILLLHFFLYKQVVYKQLGLDLQKVKQLLGLKHVTISNFANKIFAYENIATTVHYITTYCTTASKSIHCSKWMSFFFLIS